MSLQIQIDHLGIAGRPLLGGLRLDVPEGAIHTVMGASGSGKSSLLAAVCGTLEAPMAFAGQVWLQGRRIDALPTEARRVGLLFQDDLLFPHLSVAENLLFAVPPGPAAARRARVAEGLQALELAAHADADPATLSGGQRARVALMRALLAEPQALLLDEPFSRLDSALRARVRQFVFERVRARGIPALLVTHDAADVADPARLTQLRPPGGAEDGDA